MLKHTLIFLLLLTAAIPAVFAAEPKAELSVNGLRLEPHLPPGCDEISTILSRILLTRFGDIGVQLEIRDESVRKMAQRQEEVYLHLKTDYSATFEELPDLVTDAGVFEVRRLNYYEEFRNGREQHTSLTAFCRLNSRYIYAITLRGVDDIPDDTLRRFTGFSVTATPLQVEAWMVVFGLFIFLAGLFIIVLDYRSNRIGTRTSGVITNVALRRKSVDVMVSYCLPNGASAVGIHTTWLIGLLFVKRQPGSPLVGTTVPIIYRSNRPGLTILSDKGNLILGGLLCATGLGFLYLTFRGF